MYAVIDVETSGGNAKNDRITEIAIYIHNGKQITDQFTSLVNPECNIPLYITRLTGISDQMVENAPKFYEIARRIVLMTRDCVFVAHNAPFDYRFIRAEFARLGYDYQRETLCTVKLSRQLLPDYPSYSLGKLCANLGIELNNRHRAAGDALATVKLLELLLEKSNGMPVLR